MIKQTRLIMGMPVILMSPDNITPSEVEKIFDFLRYVDKQYSPFIDTSVVTKINHQQLAENKYDDELKEILALADKTKAESAGYFDVWHNETFDPSGIVKGWALQKASDMLSSITTNFYIEAGGDIQVSGVNDTSKPWRIGIRNPFDRHQNVSVIELKDYAVATSGTAIRGQHIYDPVSAKTLDDVVSLSVVAPAIIDADRMATAAFAMGTRGIQLIENMLGYEGYMIDKDGIATMTSNWHHFEVNTQ